jgi:hypothetical protein
MVIKPIKTDKIPIAEQSRFRLLRRYGLVTSTKCLTAMKGMKHGSASVLKTLSAPDAMAQEAEGVSLLGVDYLRFKTSDGGDLYLTRFGVPLREQLDPESWYAPDWFAVSRKRLLGTSVIYRVRTKPVRGMSLDLVVRFSRVGEEVPLDTLTVCKYPHAEFNSPFEEFALVMDLRAVRPGPLRPRIFTKKPLAIFVPAERLQLWQTGRLESKIAAKLARHPETELDILRRYILLYGWIEQMNAVEAADALRLPGDSRETFLAQTTCGAIRDLEQNGFRMLDIKPEHIVVRVRADGSLLRRRSGQLAYALVDYELLERVPETD